MHTNQDLLITKLDEQSKDNILKNKVIQKNEKEISILNKSIDNKNNDIINLKDKYSKSIANNVELALSNNVILNDYEYNKFESTNKLTNLYYDHNKKEFELQERNQILFNENTKLRDDIDKATMEQKMSLSCQKLDFEKEISELTKKFTSIIRENENKNFNK